MTHKIFRLGTSVLLWLFSTSQLVVAGCSDSISSDLLSVFSMDGQVQISYENEPAPLCGDVDYTPTLYEDNIKKALAKESYLSGKTDQFLYKVLDDLSESINGQKVAVIGSRNAWYESVLLSYETIPFVLTSNVHKDYLGITYLSWEEYDRASPHLFDLVICVGDIARVGLGIEEDPIDPNADLKLMSKIKEMLHPDGKAILALPIGPDKLIWKSRRIYGQVRFKALLNGFRIVKYYGFTSEHIFFGVDYQPVFLIEKK